jgi:5'-3' exonuclease
MEKHVDKNSATIHLDGKPSIQKSEERSSRKAALDKKLKALREDVEKLPEKKRGLASLYGKCKRVYRAPPSAIKEIADELSVLGWQICHCPFQGDTHIANLVRDAPDKENVTVMTSDSDLMVYEDVSSIVMPVGRSRELTTFKKSDVLKELGLESEFELLLASILTTNDYCKGVPWYGIRRNVEAVKALRPQIKSVGSRSRPAAQIRNAIKEYLRAMKGGGSKSIADYSYAIDAFALTREDYSKSATPSSTTHGQVSELLRQLEISKHRRRERHDESQEPRTAQHRASPSRRRHKKKKGRGQTKEKRKRQGKRRKNRRRYKHSK